MEGLRQRRDLMPPAVPGLGEAVAQDDRWTGTRLGVVDLDVVKMPAGWVARKAIFPADLDGRGTRLAPSSLELLFIHEAVSFRCQRVSSPSVRWGGWDRLS